MPDQPCSHCSVVGFAECAFEISAFSDDIHRWVCPVCGFEFQGEAVKRGMDSVST